MPKDEITELPFPVNGVDTASEYDKQPPTTSPAATNVRAFDSIDRMRGGSRDGLAKFIDARVSGVHEIQHLNVVVRTDPAALDFAGLALDDFVYTGLTFGVGGIDGFAIYDDPVDFPGSGFPGFPGLYKLVLSAPSGDEALADGVSALVVKATLTTTGP